MRDPLDDSLETLEEWCRTGKALQDRSMPTLTLTPKHLECLHEQLKRHRELYQHYRDENFFLREENRMLRDKLRVLHPPTNPTKQP